MGFVIVFNVLEVFLNTSIDNHEQNYFLFLHFEDIFRQKVSFVTGSLHCQCLSIDCKNVIIEQNLQHVVIS